MGSIPITRSNLCNIVTVLLFLCLSLLSLWRKSIKDKNVIKIVTGIRRFGKSTLLRLFVEKLLRDGVSKRNIIEMNFESMQFADITDYKALYHAVKDRIAPIDKTYIIAENPNEKIYIQVSETLQGTETLEHALTTLRDINDNYEKLILSMDKTFVKSYEGIKVKNLIEFLCE